MKKATQPQSSPQPGASGGVDFLVRTMIEREATGKRPIRPKNVEDLLQSSSMQDESDDPDFDCGDEDSDSAGTAESSEGSNDSENGEEGNPDDSDESDDEDYQGRDENEAGSSSSAADDSGSNDDSSNGDDDDDDSSDSDEPDATKKSALRETLEKLNEADEFIGKRPRKKKRKITKQRENAKAKKSAAANKRPGKKKSTSDSKSSSIQKASKLAGNGRKTKVAKKVILSKKPKSSSKKMLSEKKKKKRKEKKAETKHLSILSLIDSAVINQKENRKEMEVTKPICSACLGDKSDDSNEIVECDSCGISVHEVCYGLSVDNVSISSGSGSSSCTEPWFCDVCKSGSENIYCELCPMEGGLFKESTAGRWVHLVCAMYTQGVALHHDSTINLYELHYARWGSHMCAACDNDRQANTGIVISCDAGMCKTYFHATCAQKLGLLSDPNQVDFSEADPYYVSCKMHTNRETMKRRIRLFNTLQEQLRIKKERKELVGLPSGANSDHARILRKLDKVRQKTALKRAQYLNSLDNVPTQSITADQVAVSNLCNLPSSWTNGNKKQRLMHTSAKLGSDFLRKTERLGEDIVAHELEVKHEKIVSNVKRKWNVLPAMSVEYAAYYSDRENRIRGLMEQYEKSVEENHDLMDKEIGLKDIWETHSVNQEAMAEETQDVSKQLESLASILTLVCPTDKKLANKLQSIVKPKELTVARRKSPSISKGDRKSPSPRRSSIAKKASKNRVLSPSPARAGKLAVAVCDTCSKSDNQHLITRCDKCKKHYHLSCLDPPLSRMPKRSRLCGWMCSDCCEAPSEVEGQVDTEAPRTLRGRTKIHKPRKYRGSDESGDEKKTPDTDTSKSGSKKSLKSNASSSNSPEAKTIGDLAAPGPIAARSEMHTPVNGRVLSSTPLERRRRSGSANVNAAPATVPCSPILPPLVNGQVTPLAVTSPTVGGKTVSTSGNDFDSIAEGVPVVTGRELKIKKKAAKIPKAKKAKLAFVKNQEQISATTLSKDLIQNEILPSLKRKTSDSPLAAVKVNGLHESPLHPETDTTLIPKPKRPYNKKKKPETVVFGEIKQEVKSEEGTSTSALEKVVKPRKPRKKKEINVTPSSEVNPVSTNAFDYTFTDSGTMQNVPFQKLKKVRRKKEKTNISNFETPVMNPDFSAATAIMSESPAKKVRKKSVKLSPAAPVFKEARVEINGVNEEIRKIGNQLVADKMKGLQNGAVKITKKRKSNATPAAIQSTLTQATTTSVTSDEKEKEKSVPPKKRKRVSSQLQGHPNNVDSIIEAVSTGDYSDKNLGNGDCMKSEMSNIMHVVSPMSRQMAPEQNIMQGKAMGSGFNSGEMVTVDASFLIDGAPSGQPNFGITSNSKTFYQASNHKNAMSVPQDESVGSSAESGHSENVIRLQYIDTAPVPIVENSTMPPPAVATSSNTFSAGNGVCTTCTKTDSKINLVMCDKCQLEFHFMCLNPPKKTSPRRKGHPWFCSDCDDGDSQIQLQENGALPAI